MIQYTPDLTSPVVMPTPHDPNETLDYSVVWGDPIWVLSTRYEVGDRVVPTVDKGFALVCITPGISGTVEPTWSNVRNSTIVDGTVVWKVVYQLAMLDATETVSTSVWTCDQAVTLTGSYNNGKYTTIFATVTTPPVTFSQFTLINTIVTSSGRRYERSLILNVDSL